MPALVTYRRGQKVGNLVYLNEENRTNSKVRKANFLCQCGNEFIARIVNVKNFHTKSCGCLHEIYGKMKDGKKTTEYTIYYNMKTRCYNRNHESYPDMGLYQEIILLQQFFKGKFCVENVISYYEPLIKPQEAGRHYFWANFKLPYIQSEKTIGRMCGRKEDMGSSQAEQRKETLDYLGFDLSKYDYPDKDKLLRNCVSPETGKQILDRAMGIIENSNIKQAGLFSVL